MNNYNLFVLKNAEMKQFIQDIKETTIDRFYSTLILSDLWNRVPTHEVSEKYDIDRGIIQSLLNATASFAVSVVRFCQELEEFWMFVDLLNTFSKKLTFCCASELEHIIGLPFVKYVN